MSPSNQLELSLHHQLQLQQVRPSSQTLRLHACGAGSAVVIQNVHHHSTTAIIETVTGAPDTYGHVAAFSSEQQQQNQQGADRSNNMSESM